MQQLDLKHFQREQGEKAGAITWALTMHGDRLQRQMRALQKEDTEDFYQDIVAKLFATNFTSTKEMLESGDYQRLAGWFESVGRRELWKKTHRGNQTIFENEIDVASEADVIEATTSDDASKPDSFNLDFDTINQLKQLRNRKVVQALILRDAGWEWDEIAEKVGFSSRQAAHKACHAPRVKESLASAWRTLKGDELCPEIAGDLSTVAWSVGELEPEVSKRVDEHLEICPKCSAILQTHKNTLAAAPAFFPLPALALGTQAGIHDQLHAAINAINAKFHGAYAWITGQSTNTSWSTPRAAAAAAAGVFLVGGGGAAIHKAAQSHDREESTSTANTRIAPKAFYDQVDVPAVVRTQPKKKKPKKKKPARTVQVPAPTYTPAPTTTQSTQQKTQSTTTDDGSSEFLPEER